MFSELKNWHTKVTFEGTNYYVRPTRITGITDDGRGVGSEEVCPYWAAGLFVWNLHLRKSHPKNDRQLQKAVAACDAWCAQRNAETAIAEDTISRLSSARLVSL